MGYFRDFPLSFPLLFSLPFIPSLLSRFDKKRGLREIESPESIIDGFGLVRHLRKVTKFLLNGDGLVLVSGHSD